MNQIKFTFTLLFTFVFFASMQSFAQSLPIDKTIEQNQEIEIVIDSKLDRIDINFQNVIDKESVVYWTSFIGDKERSENEIGPKKYRTVTLSPKIDNENEAIRLDKKKIVLNTGDADKIIIRVEKGKVNIHAKPPNKRM